MILAGGSCMNGLAYLRKILGCSGEEFGKELSVGKSTVSKWESGALKIPDAKKKLIEEMYGCQGYLLECDITELEQERMRDDVYRCSRKKKNVLHDSFSNSRIDEEYMWRVQAMSERLSFDKKSFEKFSFEYYKSFNFSSIFLMEASLISL